MANTKQFKASIVLGGSMSATLKAAFGSTESGLKRIGEQMQALTKRQKMLGDSVQTFGRMGKNVDAIRNSYAQVTQQVNALRAAQERMIATQKRYTTLKNVGGKLMGAGAALTAAAAVVTLPLKSGVTEAKKFSQEESRIRALGLGDETSKAAVKYAQSMKTFGTSTVENLTLVRDAMSVFGDLHHAQIAAPILAKMKFGNAAFYGGEHGAENEAKFLDMLKVIELRGGTKSEADFSKQSNMVQKVISATGGRVGPEEWRHLIATGGLAAKGMRDDAFYYQLESLVQEMGGDRVGTGLSAAYTALYQGRTTKRAANNLAKYGLIADPSKVKHDKAGQVSFLDPGALKGAELFRQSQFEWMKTVLIPTLAAKGVTSKDQVLDAIGSLFSNKKGGDLIAAMYLQQLQIEKSERMNRGAYDIDQLNGEGKKSTGGKEIDLEAKASDLKLRLGKDILPLYTRALELSANALERLNGFIDRNPRFSKVMLVGLAGMATSLATIGPLLIGIGGAMTVFPYLATGVKGVAFAFRVLGASVLTNPIFWAIAAIAAGAIEIYRHWDGIKSFFVGLWTDVKEIFGGALEYLHGVFTLNFSEMVEGAERVFGGFAKFVADVFKGIYDGFMTLVDDALKAMGLFDEKKRALEVGKDQAAREKTLNRGVATGALLGGIPGANAALAYLTARVMAGSPSKPIQWNTDGTGPTPPSPDVPPMAYARGSSAQAPVIKEGDTYHITQLPGESGDDLARRISAENARNQRGQLIDGFGG